MYATRIEDIVLQGNVTIFGAKSMAGRSFRVLRKDPPY